MAGSLTTTSATATAARVVHASTVALPGIQTGGAGATTLGAGDITGALTQSGPTGISTGTLAGSTTSTVSLPNNNVMPTLAAVTSTRFARNDIDAPSLM